MSARLLNERSPLLNERSPLLIERSPGVTLNPPPVVYKELHSPKDPTICTLLFVYSSL